MATVYVIPNECEESPAVVGHGFTAPISYLQLLEIPRCSPSKIAESGKQRAKSPELHAAQVASAAKRSDATGAGPAGPVFIHSGEPIGSCFDS